MAATDTATPATTRDAAIAMWHAGLCVVPPSEDGAKRPGVTSWKQYQTRRPTLAQVEAWYSVERHGVGVICGTVSGNLEMLEFEGRAVEEDIWDDYLGAAKNAGILTLFDRVISGYWERTPGGGFHLLYRCEAKVDGNLKLARRPATAAELEADPADKIKVLIETRGERGYTILAPSHGPVHPTGRSWDRWEGDIASIVTITAEERTQLLDLARTFDRLEVVAEREISPTPPVAPPTAVDELWAQFSRPSGEQWFDATVDDFNRHTTWAQILEGWAEHHTAGDVTYWTRPGKARRDGWSATTNARGTDRLIVFSSSVAGFDTTPHGPSGQSYTSYDRFSAWTILHHGADRLAAARAARAAGHGPAERAESVARANTPVQVPAGQPSSTPQQERPFTPQHLDVTVAPPPPQMAHPWLYAGRLCVLQSEPGVGKSWLATWLALQVMNAGGHVVYLDEEGGSEIVTERLHALGAGQTTIDTYLHYLPFEQRRWDLTDLAALDALIANTHPTLAVLDSLPDFLTAAGLSEDSAGDITTFVNLICSRFRTAGAAQLLLDHLVKPPAEGKAKRSRYSRGSGAKLAKADATLLLEAETEFDANTSGRLRLWKTKDRRGRLDLPNLTKPSLVIDVPVSNGTVRFNPTTTAGTWDGPTDCMAAVRDILTHTPGIEFTGNQLVTQVRAQGHAFEAKTIREAAARLALRDDEITFRRGPRNAELYSAIKPIDHTQEAF